MKKKFFHQAITLISIPLITFKVVIFIYLLFFYLLFTRLNGIVTWVYRLHG